MNAIARCKDDCWGAMPEHMRALPNNRWRNFVDFFVMDPSNQAKAARLAGFGRSRSTPLTMTRIASRLMRDERIVAAVQKESQKILRGGAAEASKALLNLVRDPEHKDHARGIAMVLARTDPEITRHDLNVVHRVVDADQESLEELAALRQLGTPRPKLLELFGGNGLARLEKLEAAQAEQRATAANVIEGEAIEEMTDGQ